MIQHLCHSGRLRSWVALFTAVLAAGCHSPYADITTTQDPQYPIGKKSKFGTPEEASSVLSARLATDRTKQEMQAMGYVFVPADQADYIVRADAVAKDLTMVDNAGPSIGMGGGGGSGGVFTGAGVSFPIGSPQAETMKRTQLDITIETALSPKIAVWQGKILAATDDELEYDEQFYRALLLHVGENYHGTVRLDKIPATP